MIVKENKLASEMPGCAKEYTETIWSTGACVYT